MCRSGVAGPFGGTLRKKLFTAKDDKGAFVTAMHPAGTRIASNQTFTRAELVPILLDTMSADHRAPHASHALPPRGGEPVRVLVVDDDTTVRGVARRVLESRGHLVLEAESGRRALTLLREGAEVGAVVADLKMADGSGGWLLAHIAYEFPQLLPFLVLITGDAGSASAAHVAARWSCPVLAKPFGAAQLLGALASLGLATNLT